MYLSIALNQTNGYNVHVYICAYHRDATKVVVYISSSYFEVYNNEVKKKCKCLNLASMFNEPYNYIHVNGVNSLCVAYIIAPTRRCGYQIVEEVEI